MNRLKILLILIIPILLSAKVELKAPKSFYNGDQIVFSISATGSNIEFPDIKRIDGFLVQNAGTSTHTSIVNGVRNESLTKNYVFIANRSVTIPVFSIKIDGKIEKTKEYHIKMNEVKKTVSSYYSLDLNVDKKDVYVGEAIKFVLKFKYRKDLQIVDLKFTTPTFENFWAKELKQNNKKNNSDFVEQELHYLLFPQKSGKVVIPALKVGIVVVDSRYSNYGGFFRSSSTKTIPVYSNKIELDVKPLPNDVRLIGDFKIDSKVDKQTVNSGEAVSYDLVIDGRGNLDDIDEIKLNIPGATIYENPAKKEYDLKGGVYGGKYTKTYSIVASNDFTIPSITLNYFDKKTNSIKTIKTKPYDIKIKGKVQSKKAKLEVSSDEVNVKQKIITKVVKTSDDQKILFFIYGVVSTLVLVLIVYLVKTKKTNKEDTPIEKSIKKAKTNSELLKLLLVYINIDKELDKIIYSLEKEDSNNRLKDIKKDILQMIKDKKLDI